MLSGGRLLEYSRIYKSVFIFIYSQHSSPLPRIAPSCPPAFLEQIAKFSNLRLHFVDCIQVITSFAVTCFSQQNLPYLLPSYIFWQDYLIALFCRRVRVRGVRACVRVCVSVFQGTGWPLGHISRFTAKDDLDPLILFYNLCDKLV